MQTKSETRNKIQFEHAYVAYQQGNLLQAEMLCKEILQTVPLKTAEGFQSAYLLGVIEYQNSEFETAAKHLQQALTVNSEHPQLLNALGGVYIGQEKYEVAQPLLEKAVRLSPRFQDARTNLAICYRGLDQTSQAIRVLKESKQLGIDNANGAKLLAECLMDQSDYSEAENLLIEQLGREPEDWYALNLLGICTSKQENFTKACSYFERAQALSATNTAIELNLASAYQQAGNFEKAEVIYHSVLGKDSDLDELIKSKAQFNLAISQLNQLKLKEGWKNYQARPGRYVTQDSTPGDLKNAVVQLVADQPLGDELFFLRFTHELKERCAEIHYVAPYKLKSLLSYAPSIDRILDEIDLTLADLTLSTSDLPALLGCSTPDQQPSALPLNIDPLMLEKFKESLNLDFSKPLIALTWRAGASISNTNIENPLYKNIPLELLTSSLKSIEGNFCIIQRFPEDKEISVLERELKGKVTNFSHLNESLLDMAMLLKLCTSYVGVSNTNMHIHAGLGGHAHVFVPYPAEWKWGRQNNSNIWFSDFNAYHQDENYSWDTALEQLRTTLSRQVESSA